ncbi:MAG: outer membrane protein assembly factor BamB family protein [Planctomycetota bacterium]|jgi:hypothetical protein
MLRKPYLCTFLLTLCLLSLPVQAVSSVKTVNLDAQDIVYDPFSQRIYASVSSSDLNHGNSIAIIDPLAGVIEDSVFAGSDPRKLAISNDGEYIYAGLNGAGSVSRFHIPSQTVDKTFSLGSGSYGTTYVEDIDVQPGNSNVIAVSRYRKGISPRHDGVAIYDNGIRRPQKTGDHTGSNVIEFSDSPSILYGYCNETTGFRVYTNIVNEYGVSIASSHSGLISGFGVDIEYDDGFLYTTSGRVIDTQIMQLVGQFGASGKIEPDSTVRRIFVINGSTIYAYNQKTFVKEAQYTVSGASGSPRNLIRWGINGLAYSTSGKQVVIVQTDIVPDPPTLTGLVIEGPNHLPGYQGEYKLVATFDDGVVLDVTKKSRWYTDPNTYTSIDNTGTLYVFGTEEYGTTTIRADYIWAGTLHEAAKEISYEGTIPATGNLIRLQIDGPRQVLQQSSVQYTATAFFDDSTQYDVTSKVMWNLSNTIFADIDETGLLTIRDINRPCDLVICAFFGFKDVELETNKTVIVLEDSSQMTASDWPMFQANPQHTGYVPIALDPEDFSLRWEKQIGDGRQLNPVTAANGKVFVSLYVYFNDVTSFFVVDARDGEVLWSKGLGRVYSVNPPSFAYGNVYIQTGKESSSGMPPYLRGFNADTGETIFESTFSAQWGRYYAPTIYDGSVYINGGYYGGMYGFNAFSGEKMWFRSLTQVAGWTPAVEGNYSYAFLKGTLYAINRYYGTQDFTIKAGSSSSTQVPVKGAYNDILVINGKTLYCLDLSKEEVGWEIPGDYTGMPSIAEGVVYAVNNGMLEARDETTGDFVWSWTPPQGSLKSPVIVTQTHVIACTSENTYAIEILGRDSDWSCPVSGYLSLGNDTLYIAHGDILTAIATPEYIPANPVKLEIEGPDEVFESSTNAYQAKVYFSDGRIRNRTALCNWTLTGTPMAAIDQGSLCIGELLYPQKTVVLRAEYTQDQTTVVDEKEVTIHISGTVCKLVTRNLEEALKIKQEILLDVERALARERASAEIIKGMHHNLCDINNPDLNKSWNQTQLAIVREKAVEKDLDKSIENLSYALEIFSAESAYLEDMQQFKKMLKPAGDEHLLNADINGDGKVNMLDMAEISRFWLVNYKRVNF